MNNSVEVWEEEITIPTYPVGEPGKNPMFFEKRVYQGSSGVVYPNPIIEKVYDDKVDKTYTGLFLENRYLKIMVLPEIGGRVQTAYDKVKERHFVYHNQVIKPALVGLLGPWISGGIEFNWPQHHRPSTFQPIDYTLDENEDGSKTIWVNEIELMFHTKGMAGFTMYPDKAYLEINAQLYNRTNLPQTFLWWANPAVSVNDDYQSVFPPDVNAVFDHGKRDVATFPIAEGTYYKVDYSPGTDISRYKNIPVPTSYMAIQSDYDFVGGYEHDTEAGLLHVANHHVSPGKKQWTWGNGDFGKAWDRNLTDEDGPYIELMTGVYTDNQPDFTWLMPYEKKSFSQYFFPYGELGVVKNATKDLQINIESNHPNKAKIQASATSPQEGIVKLRVDDAWVYEGGFSASPESVFEVTIDFEQEISEKNYLLVFEDTDGRELIRYEPAKNKEEDIPDPAQPADKPSVIENTEQLYLTGRHLEQYRHATYSPVPYYEEALRRDPKDIRNNNALGKWYLRNGRFQKSESYFRTAVETLTDRNPNPYSGEAFYNLGLSLKYQQRPDEAYAAFYKATWNAAWQDKGYFGVAEIDVSRSDYEQGLEHINRSLDRNRRSGKAMMLKVAILRKLNRLQEALEVGRRAVDRDLFNFSVYYERHLLHTLLEEKDKAQASLDKLMGLSRGDVQNLIHYALDYASAGLYKEAGSLLEHAVDEQAQETHPMVFYYLGWFQSQRGNETKALKYYTKAADANPDYCFPNRLEDITPLREAMNLNKQDAKAPYYLGCLYYDKEQYDCAIELWEQSARRDDQFATVHRNLGIAYFNKENAPTKAVRSFEKGFSLNPSDARVLMELNQLNKRTNKDPEERLQKLEDHMELIEARDDLYLERIAIYNFLGRHKEAYDLIMARKFHPWEGGEGRVSAQYVYSLTEMAKEDIRNDASEDAIQKLEQAQHYPRNLGEGKLFGTRENDIYYWMGVAHEKLGNSTEAKVHWQNATEGDYEPTAAVFYNDQPPEKILYQALARQKLGEVESALQIYRDLIDYGKEHMHDEVQIDYFAISLPDLLTFDADLSLRNKIHCKFMVGLGYIGLDKLPEAKSLFNDILDAEAMHMGAKTHLKLADWIEDEFALETTTSEDV